VDVAKKQADHQIWQARAIVRQPFLLASLGQWLGLVAVLSVLVLAGFVAYQGHGLVAGVLGVVDIIGLAAVFQGRRRPERPTQPPQQQPDTPPQ
jgi:cadmium resistance protein CadD (predicted permease)